MKKIIFLLSLLISINSSAQTCTGLGTSPVKAPYTKTCRDTTLIESVLNAVKAQSLTVAGVPITGSPVGSAGGDLSVTYPNPIVSKINGSSVDGIASNSETQAGTEAYNIACWGNSLTAGNPNNTITGSYPQILASVSGRNVFNGGVAGETSTQIASRMLADVSKYNYSVVICSGRNNFTDSAGVLADIASMVAALGHTRYVILSILNSTAEPNPSTGYTQIMYLNNRLSSIYGSHYLDIRSYLVSQYNPGIPQDVIDHSNDVPPSSLRADPLHLNATGYSLEGNYIYSQKISVLAPTINKVPYVTSIGSLFHNITNVELNNNLKITGGGLIPATSTTIVTNGTFAGSITGWTNGGNWSYSSGTALHTSGSAATISQSLSLTSGIVYYVTYTVSGMTAGTLTLSLGSLLGVPAAITTNGTYNYSYQASSTASFALTFTPTSTFDGALSNVSVVSITKQSNPVIEIFNTGSSSSDVIEIRSSQTGLNNLAIGYNSQLENMTGTNNTSFGFTSLQFNAVGSYNTAFGHAALNKNINGITNSCNGAFALFNNVSGSRNVAAGYSALFANTSGGDNSCFGYNSGVAINTGSRNTVFGANAGKAMAGNANMTAIGESALPLATGTGNTGLGKSSGAAITSGQYNLAIGAFCDVPNATTNGQLNIGCVIFGTNLNTSGSSSSSPTASGAIGIGIASPSSTLHVNGDTRTKHLVGGSSAPTIAAGTGAGTSPTVSLTKATDLSGVINVTTGTLPTLSATVVTVTFNVAYGSAPKVTLEPANGTAAALSGVTMVFVDDANTTTTQFILTAGTTALAGTTAYKWYYTVTQ